jgi:hypothetical protein
MPHTSLVKGRTVPAEVKREVASRSSNGARQGRKCAVPYCDNEIHVEHAHVTPHRLGGAREAKDIVRLCKRHHGQFDAGYLKNTGTAANPRFTDREGNDLSRRVEVRDDAAKSPPPPEPPGVGAEGSPGGRRPPTTDEARRASGGTDPP